MKIPLIAALMLAACNNAQTQAPTPRSIEPLPARDVTLKAATLRQLVDQQCFDRLDNVHSFETGLKDSGWHWIRTQTADPENRLALDVWQLPGVTLVRGQPVKDAVWTCTLVVQSSVTPPADKLKNELSLLAGKKPSGSDEWWWKRSQTNKIHMDVAESAQGVTINVENYHLPWWRSFLE